MSHSTAHAKVNLTLNVTGHRADGYHTLHSLIAFTDIGDTLHMSFGQEMQLDVTGPFAHMFTTQEKSAALTSKNLVIKALYILRKYFQTQACFHINLDKRLPLSSGLGGGTSDAACAVRIALSLMHETMTLNLMDILTREIGADFPICFHGKPAFVEGIGETITDAKPLPHCHILLVNPLKPCPTSRVFQNFAGPSSNPPPEKPDLSDQEIFLDYLRKQGNDLLAPAQELIPEIGIILHDLNTVDGCLYAAMSGSGASCFALFDTLAHTTEACALMHEKHPDFWSQAGELLQPYPSP